MTIKLLPPGAYIITYSVSGLFCDAFRLEFNTQQIETTSKLVQFRRTYESSNCRHFFHVDISRKKSAVY
jgi:hypothetical protein